MLLNELDQRCGACDVIGLCAQPYSELCLCTDSRFGSLSEEQYIKLANEVIIKNAPKEEDFEDDEKCCEALNIMIADEVEKKLEEKKNEESNC